jgi:hypothetical protein
MSTSQTISALLGSSPAVRDGASVPSGDGACTSRSGMAWALIPVAVRGGCVTLPRRPAGLIALPLPPGFGMCLACTWEDASGDAEATMLHQRETAHPTIRRPRAGAHPVDGGR